MKIYKILYKKKNKYNIIYLMKNKLKFILFL